MFLLLRAVSSNIRSVSYSPLMLAAIAKKQTGTFFLFAFIGAVPFEALMCLAFIMPVAPVDVVPWQYM